MLTALDAQFSQNAAGPRRDRDLAVGFGAARQGERRIVRFEFRRRDGNTEQRLCLGLVGPHRGFAMRAVVRQKMARRDPQGRSGDHADGGETSGFHDMAFSDVPAQSPGLESRQ